MLRNSYRATNGTTLAAAKPHQSKSWPPRILATSNLRVCTARFCRFPNIPKIAKNDNPADFGIFEKSVRQSKSLAFPGISRISGTDPVLCKITENREIAQFLRFSPTLQFSRDSKYSRWYSESQGNRESHCFRHPPTHNVGRPSAAHIKRGEPPLYEHCEWAVV